MVSVLTASISPMQGSKIPACSFLCQNPAQRNAPLIGVLSVIQAELE